MKKFSILSIVSLLISITAFIISGTNVYTHILWIILSVLSAFFPIVSKYFRKKFGCAGKSFEITAFVLGAFNFYFLLYVLTDINLLEIIILVGLICLLYILVFNNITAVIEKSETDKVVAKNHLITTKGLKQKKKQLPFYHIIAIILSALSILSIIVAMNVQDSLRNTREPLNTTMLYFVLIGANVLYCVILIFLKKCSVLKIFIAFVPAFFTIIALNEGSIISSGYYNYYGHFYYYGNHDIVDILNYVWTILSLMIPLTNLGLLSLHFRAKWHRSLKYREKCYMRVAKLKNYLDNGIISQEEFEISKQQILKNIKMR